jgi:hypothetical protein
MKSKSARKKKEKLTPEEANLRNQKMCLRKSIFWSAASAGWKAKALSEEIKKAWYSYKCPNCLQWHLARARETKSSAQTAT